MEKEIVNRLEKQIKNSTDSFQEELDISLLRLYQLGFVEITIEGEKMNVSVTDAGTEAFMNDLALSLVDTADA
ncbi:hypothetical protein CMI47_00510 [Candidatus Pacearchaeota archaeon]|nr:hypothetical protein [Candidatus Pacearchaeota archaeon]|tara:strand:- start:132 stop:350 length:219 start_codon:yes stop_codon:yes gene_type:complete